MKYGQAPTHKERYGRGPDDVALFHVPRRAPAREKGTVIPEPKEEKEVGPFFIQGQKASDLEWRVYKALLRLRWRDSNIVFQTPILGGRRPGGQVLDFVVYGNAQVTVIQPQGDYWHKFGTQYQKHLLYVAQIKRVMPSANVVALFAADLQTDDQAYRVLLRHVGRGGG